MSNENPVQQWKRIAKRIKQAQEIVKDDLGNTSEVAALVVLIADHENATEALLKKLNLKG